MNATETRLPRPRSVVLPVLPALLGVLCVPVGAATPDGAGVRHRDTATATQSPRAQSSAQSPAQSPHVPDPAALERWQLPRDGIYAAPSAAATAVPTESTFRVPWDDSPSWMHVAPEVARVAKQFRRQGLPVLHLWQSQNYQLALGLNARGRPGIYFTQKLGD